MSKKVYIGIGHGGGDPGACANGLREADLALAMGFLVQTQLQQSGAETKMSRTSNVDFTTSNKITDANNWGADVVIDLHFNAAGGIGFEIFRSQNTDGSDKLATAINDAIMATGRKSRGVKTKVQNGVDYYGIIRQTNAPAVLVEYAFVDNTTDVVLLTDPSNQQAWAEATAKGVLSYLGISYKEQQEAPTDLTLICGTASASAAQMNAYLKAINPDAPLYGNLYIEEGEREGIRGDIAFAQSCLETGNMKFGGDVKADQNNLCGLGATGGGEPGNSFATPQEGIQAQIQHLKAYASTDDLAGECIDPRFKWVRRGVAPYVEWLGIPDNPHGKGWAAGAGYGAKILTILEAILKTEAEAEAQEGDTITVDELRAMGYRTITL